MLRTSLGTQVLGDAIRAERRIEGYRLTAETIQGRKVVAAAGMVQGRRYVDIDWLPAAADTYHISADIRDYIIAPVPIVTTDVPNRNLQAFPLGEVTFFDPLHGRFVYQTFIGKPCHQDHDNQDPTKAKGVIIDAHFDYIPKYKVGKITALAAFDRTKDPKLVRSILSGERDSYSMGAYVTTFVCSVCNKPYGKDGTKGCLHQLDPQQPVVTVINGKLNYMNCRGVTYFELSSVRSPADISASSDDKDILTDITVVGM